ncbi:uncharacterized protein K460DRAFT_203072 [Cucurbitaria berberidis CBS 394.84]|uniref:Uncharacterized protein n=1 Tax=Cucurbitaria berberidis CBS 394.84 TaxID=1168544 RepID=A0A9P4L3T4_9PLEO|nr:uncharacterized protein K460DRAFT_203072 [Cucurbitaria berberidis CBS 394.84]KAF1840113.1 hypothetical protein K460DRAFT_203072 [Cucurbitaria berberidis CBS 394.84]
MAVTSDQSTTRGFWLRLRRRGVLYICLYLLRPTSYQVTSLSAFSAMMKVFSLLNAQNRSHKEDQSKKLQSNREDRTERITPPFENVIANFPTAAFHKSTTPTSVTMSGTNGTKTNTIANPTRSMAPIVPSASIHASRTLPVLHPAVKRLPRIQYGGPYQHVDVYSRRAPRCVPTEWPALNVLPVQQSLPASESDRFRNIREDYNSAIQQYHTPQNNSSSTRPDHIVNNPRDEGMPISGMATQARAK